MEKQFIETERNPVAVKTASIPVLDYTVFFDAVDKMMASEDVHCLAYFVAPENDNYRFICCMADDAAGKVRILSHMRESQVDTELKSLTASHFAFHVFEREIHENYGIRFSDHPWLKPVRYPFDRSDLTKNMNNYPFFTIEGDHLHEVGVGPIHAGVIEPGYFRFICKGEHVLHLEIQLGYQHRGIEKLFIHKKWLLARSILSESIAGDTVVGHALSYAMVMESLAGNNVSSILATERIIALELERIAIHIGDTAALCTDIAYQFGQVVNEALRTLVINTTQLWCGNRFGKGLIRPGGSNYPLTNEVRDVILKNLQEVEERYRQVTERIFSLTSVLGRFEGTGKVTTMQASLVGAVGMAARSSGMYRDIRWSHPFSAFVGFLFEPVMLHKGDVWSRAMLRKLEVERSIAVIRELLEKFTIYDLRFTNAEIENPKSEIRNPKYDLRFTPLTLAISLTEGWRGEICHVALTDDSGKIIHYKAKDPSLHNWMALALAMKNQEISDFPLCNKSFNLSYCGNDL